MSRELDPFAMPRLLNIIEGDTIRAFHNEIGMDKTYDSITGDIVIEFQHPEPETIALESYPPNILEAHGACLFNVEIPIEAVEYVFVAAPDDDPDKFELDIQNATTDVRRRYTGSKEKYDLNIFLEPNRVYTLLNTDKKPWM